FQACLDNLSESSAEDHPSEDLLRQEQEVKDVVHGSCIVAQSQAPQEFLPQSDTQVAVLTTQVALLIQETLELQAAITGHHPVGSSGSNGCCPGIPGQPFIHCAGELIALANEVDHSKKNYDILDKGFQEMTELIDSSNDCFSPCLFKSCGPDNLPLNQKLISPLVLI
ncbi:hypothetical protein DSO57_1002415, partial [Entomophthora muscae]